jgi:hypothetical protein
MTPVREHTSEILASIVEQMEAKESINLGDMIVLLGERVAGLLILVFCIPNCLPIPNFAGLSAFTGIPIGLIGVQMVAGIAHPWFPGMMMRKQFSGKAVAKVLQRAIPFIKKVEKALHPRGLVMSYPMAQRLLGVAFVALATVMSLPIPFGNFLPGLAMALMAIGLIESDGLVISLGLAVGVGTFVVLFALGDALLEAVLSMIS